MPDEYDMFVPYVKMAFEYVGKYFYENPRLPGCDGWFIAFENLISRIYFQFSLNRTNLYFLLQS